MRLRDCELRRTVFGGRNSPEERERLNAFLSSKHFQEMPINKTSTRLFALIAHDAATHQKTPPDEGTANDIDLVSAYLPYCDAMMIDKRTRLLLE